MNIKKKWFKEAEKVCKVHQHNKSRFIIYRGFKLIFSKGKGYSVVDVRRSEFYTPLSKKDFQVIAKNGFIKGADMLCFARNFRRIEAYQGNIKGLRAKIAKAKAEMPKDWSRNEKRIRTSTEKIEDYKSLIKLLGSRNTQIEIKYN